MNSYSKFINLFSSIAPEKHRYTVFSDFVTMSAISLRNVMEKNSELEGEYLKISSTYQKEEMQKICQLFGILTNYLDADPRDCLGSIFMDLGFGEDMKGQFFTPEPVSDLMAKLTLGETIASLKQQPFITLSDTACGAGAMLLSAAKWIRRAGYSLEQVLWIQAIDIDRVTALMCYVQLSLWCIPAEVIVGDSLSMKYREHWYTFAHHRYGWAGKLQRRWKNEANQQHVLQPKQNGFQDDQREPQETNSTVPSPDFNHTFQQGTFDF